jgi:outer membrane protein OmpA-like peptidoglycan-associated protein
MKRSMMAIIVGMMLVSSACAVPPPAQTSKVDLPPPGPDGMYRITFKEGMPVEARYIHIAIGPDTFAQCPATRAHFEFDSSEPNAQHLEWLRLLASCVNGKDMRERDILLIGRADSSGNAGYNQRLGRLRAERVKELLVKLGVDAKRMRVASRGEEDAQADGSYSHGWDRRVDVVVLGGVHRPEGYTSAHRPE